APEPRLLVELLLGRSAVARPESSSTVLRGRRERRLEVRVVLERPVLAPHLWIRSLFGHLDEPDEGLSGFLLSLEDVGEERHEEHGDAGDTDEAGDEDEPARSIHRHVSPPFVGRRSSARAMARARVTVHAVQLLTERPRARVHSVDESPVAANAVDLHQHAITRSDLDRLL